jgi:hypothetical protein
MTTTSMMIISHLTSAMRRMKFFDYFFVDSAMNQFRMTCEFIKILLGLFKGDVRKVIIFFKMFIKQIKI